MHGQESRQTAGRPLGSPLQPGPEAAPARGPGEQGKLKAAQWGGEGAARPLQDPPSKEQEAPLASGEELGFQATGLPSQSPASPGLQPSEP